MIPLKTATDVTSNSIKLKKGNVTRKSQLIGALLCSKWRKEGKVPFQRDKGLAFSIQYILSSGFSTGKSALFSPRTGIQAEAASKAHLQVLFSRCRSIYFKNQKVMNY